MAIEQDRPAGRAPDYPPGGQAIDDPGRLAALLGTGLLDTAPDGGFDRLTSLAARVLRTPVALVSLVDDHRQFFKSEVGLHPPWAQLRETPLTHSFCQQEVTTGEPLIIGDALTDERVRGNPAIADLGVRAYLGMPLRSASGHTVGALCVIDEVARVWTGEEIDLLADLAAAVSAEIQLQETARLANAAAAAARRAEERLALLNSVTTALSETLDLGVALGRLSRLLVPGLADACLVEMYGDLPGVIPGLLAVYSSDPEVTRLLEAAHRIRPRTRVPGTLAFSVATSREPSLITGIDDDYLAEVAVDDTQLDYYRRLRLTSAAAVPLVARSGTIGVLTFATTSSSGRRLGPDDLRLIAEIGGRASVAVDNARLYTIEHHRATSLQRGLLPELAPIAALDAHAVYLPGRKDAAVGGDWYDLFELPDGTISLTIGDVMGHDITAAAAMGQLRSVLRVCAWQGDRPSTVVSQLDRLVDHFHHADLATLVYGTLDLRPGGAATLVVTNAGHPPPLLVGPGGARYLDGATSPLIGAVDLPERVEQTWQLPPGWSLVLYTDGLVESAALPLDEGLDRLARVAATTAGLPAAEACARITAACGASDDDIALLVVRAPSR